MKRQVVHAPITQMKEVGTRDLARKQMHALGARLVEAIGEPAQKKIKKKHIPSKLARHKGKKQKTVHAVPVERAVPVSQYLQAADLSPPQLARVLKRAAETRPHIQKAIVPPRVSKLHIATDVQMQRKLKLQYDKPPRSLTRDPSDLPKNRGQRQSLSRSQSHSRTPKPIIHNRRVPSRSRTPSQGRHDKQKPLRSHSSARETGTVGVLGTSVSRKGTERNMHRDNSGHRIGRHHSSADRMSVQRNVRSGLNAEDKAVYQRMQQRDSRSAETFRKKLDDLNEQARKRELLKPKNFAINDRLAGDDWLDSQRRIQERMKHVPEMLAKQKKNEELRKKRWESQEHVRLSEFKQKEIQQRIDQEKMKSNALIKRQSDLTNRASRVANKDLGFNFKTEFVSTRLPKNKKKEVGHIRHTINTIDKQVKNSEQKLKDAIQDQKTWTHKARFYKNENEKRMSESRERYSMERSLPPKTPLHKTATAYTPVTHESKRERKAKWYREQNERRMQAAKMRSQSREVAPVSSAEIHAARIDDANYRKAQQEAEKQRKQKQEQRRTRQISEKANRLFRQAEHHRIQSEKSRDQMLHQSREAEKERRFQEMKRRQLSQGPRLDRDKLGLSDSKTHDENMRLNRALMQKYTLSMQELSRIFSKTDLIHQREQMKQELSGVMAYDPHTLMSIDPEPVTPQRSKAKIKTHTVTKKPQNVAPPRRKVVITPPKIKPPIKQVSPVRKSGTVTQVRPPSPVVQKPPVAKHMRDLNAAAQKLVQKGKPKLREELLARGIAIDDEWTAFELAKQLEQAGEKKTTYEDLDMAAKKLTDKTFPDLSEIYHEKYHKPPPLSWNKYDLAREVSKIQREKKQRPPARIIKKDKGRERHKQREIEARKRRNDITHQRNLKAAEAQREKERQRKLLKEQEEQNKKERLKEVKQAKEREHKEREQKQARESARARLQEQQKQKRAELQRRKEEIAATKLRQKEAQRKAKELRREKARLQKEAQRLQRDKADAETRRQKAAEIKRFERDAKKKQKEAETLKKNVASQRRKRELEARRQKELQRKQRIAEKKEKNRLQREQKQLEKEAKNEKLRIAKQRERFKKEQMKERHRAQRELREKERAVENAQRLQEEKQKQQELRARLKKQEEQRQKLSREREAIRHKSQEIQRRIQHQKAQASIQKSKGDARRQAAHDARTKQLQEQQRKLADLAKLKQQEKAAAQKKKQHLQDIRDRSADMQRRIIKEKTLQGQRAADKKRQERLRKVLERSHAYQEEKEIEDLASRLQSTVRIRPKVQRVSRIHVPTSTQMKRKLYIDTGPQMNRVLKLQHQQQHVRKNPKRINLNQSTMSFTQRVERIQPTHEEHLQKRQRKITDVRKQDTKRQKKEDILQRLQQQQDDRKKKQDDKKKKQEQKKKELEQLRKENKKRKRDETDTPPVRKRKQDKKRKEDDKKRKDEIVIPPPPPSLASDVISEHPSKDPSSRSRSSKHPSSMSMSSKHPSSSSRSSKHPKSSHSSITSPPPSNSSKSSVGLRLRGGVTKPRKSSKGKIQSTTILKQRNFAIEQLSPKSVILRARKWSKAVYQQLIAFLKTLKGKLLIDNKKMTKKAAIRYIVSRMQKNNAVRVEVS